MNKKNISVLEAAEKMGKSAQFVRVGLQRGVLSFGVAVKNKSRWSYYINPAKFREFIGEEQSLNLSDEEIERSIL